MLTKWFCGTQTNFNCVSPFRAQLVILFLDPFILFPAQFLSVTSHQLPHWQDDTPPSLIRTLPTRLNLHLPFDLSPGLPLTMTLLSLTHSFWRIENSFLHRISLSFPNLGSNQVGQVLGRTESALEPLVGDLTTHPERLPPCQSHGPLFLLFCLW